VAEASLPRALRALSNEAYGHRGWVSPSGQGGDRRRRLRAAASSPAVSSPTCPQHRFPEPADHDVVYLEHAGREHRLDDPDIVALHVSLFDHILAAALRPDDSLKLLAQQVLELEVGE
jgi:hypothetical protein